MNSENLTEFAKKFKSAVVLINTFNKKGELLKELAGFFINSKGGLITVEAVIRGSYSAVTKTAYGDEYPVKGIVGINRSWSLAKIIVETKGKGTPFLELCTTLPHKGAPVLVISNPLSPEGTILEGTATYITGNLFNGFIEIKDINSRLLGGSPVLNFDGQVIGMAVFTWCPIEDVPNFCVPSLKIINLKRRKMQTLSEWTEEHLAKSARSSAITAGDINMLMGFYYEAIEAYKKAGEVKLPRVYFNMGLAYQYFGRYQEAIEAYKKAINLKPKWIKAHYNLGINYLMIDNGEAALNQYRILEKLDFISANQLLALIFNTDVCLGNA